MPRPRSSSPRTETATLRLTLKQKQEMEREAKARGVPTISDYLRALHDAACDQGERSTGSTKRDQRITAATRPALYLRTAHGRVYHGDSLGLLHKDLPTKSVDLIMTSPPFGLVRKKAYGNEDADEYLQWFRPFAEGFRRVLKDSGSVVIDIGGAWKKGTPTRSLYHFELLVMLCREYGFHLAQEYYWWNPSKLPTPAEWVNVRRVRVKDAVNCLWWLSLSPWPKASNRRVLQPYSQSMLDLFKNGYTPKLRPSGHDISSKFGRDNSGAIPPNLLALPNTESNGAYQRYCKLHGLPQHPARFPSGIPAYFVSMLTDQGDMVLDPFGGSCVTGEVCEKLQRRWICCDLEKLYLDGARARFQDQSQFSNVNGAAPQDAIKPYTLYPPLGLRTYDTSPLPRDGGRRRPSAT